MDVSDEPVVIDALDEVVYNDLEIDEAKRTYVYEDFETVILDGRTLRVYPDSSDQAVIDKDGRYWFIVGGFTRVEVEPNRGERA